MNRPLLGNVVPRGRYSAVAAFVSLLFAAGLCLPGKAGAGSDDSMGKVVKPKKVVLTPKMTQGDIHVVGYAMPEAYSTPYGIVTDKNNNVWFTLMSANSLGVLNPETNEMKLYRIPSTEGLPDIKWDYSSKERKPPDKTLNVYTVGSPGNVTVDREGNVWFVMQLGNSIVRFEPAKERFTEFLLSTPNSQPYDLAVDSKGRIWFIEMNVAKLSFINPATRKITEIPLEKGAKPMGLAVGPDDKIWVNSVEGNYIGRYDPSTRKLKRYSIMTEVAQPGKMVFDKDGRLWFCAAHAKQVGVFYPDKEKFGIVDVPGYNAVPQGIIGGPDGLIWYVDSMMNNIGFFDPVNAGWSTFEIPTHMSQPMNITVDSKGDIWYTESDRMANEISRVIRSSVPKPGTAAAGAAMERTKQKMKENNLSHPMGH